MPILSDMEMIKSAIIYGDLDDAMSLIRRRQRSLSYALKNKPTKKITEYSEFLTALENLLKGELALSDFKVEVDRLPDLMDSLDITGDRDNFLASFYYLLEYSLDRYNVRFPQYDGKRCDDR